MTLEAFVSDCTDRHPAPFGLLALSFVERMDIARRRWGCGGMHLAAIACLAGPEPSFALQYHVTVSSHRTRFCYCWLAYNMPKRRPMQCPVCAREAQNLTP